VDDRRAREVLHPEALQPAAGSPDPVRDERVDDREDRAEGEVDPELRALGHRAPDDRERDAGEDDLEQPARRAGIPTKAEYGAFPTARRAPNEGAKPSVPTSAFPLPNASPNPTSQ
jgi:hypothetical protein